MERQADDPDPIRFCRHEGHRRWLPSSAGRWQRSVARDDGRRLPSHPRHSLEGRRVFPRAVPRQWQPCTRQVASEFQIAGAPRIPALHCLQSQRARERVAEAALAPKEWLAMGASRLMSVVTCCVVAGCGSAVQPGLANAPGLGGATPETRVHDAIANGRDACGRSMFPRGGVLRGQVPPCTKEPTRTAVWAPLPPNPVPPLDPLYVLGGCLTRPSQHKLGVAQGLIAFPGSQLSLSSSTCYLPENASPVEAGGVLHLEWTGPSTGGGSGNR